MDPIHQRLVPMEDIHLFVHGGDELASVRHHVRAGIEILDVFRIDLPKHTDRRLDLVRGHIGQNCR